MLTFPIPEMALRQNHDITVARIELGLTIYLDDAGVWSKGGAAKILEAFLQRVPPERIQHFTTSLLTEWRPVSIRSIMTLLDALTSWSWLHARPRHFFTLQVADDTGAPSYGFTYTEIDPERAERASLLELTFARDSDPAELFQLAMEIGHSGPFWAGIGGHAARWNPDYKSTAFTQVHKWCKRFRGVDVQDPQEMAWGALQGLPGTGWLTMLGDRLAKSIDLDLDRLAAHEWTNPVTVIRLSHGVLIRAGEQPTVGDLNLMEYPAAYAEVARYLAPWFAPPPEYWGDFWNEKDTTAWQRRLIEPEGWP